MNPFTHLMVSITGHHVGPETKIQEVAGLSKIGLSISFASVLAALQFAVAGYFLVSNLDPEVQTTVTAIMAVIGACIVLVIDRNFIYAADTTFHSSPKTAYLYLGIRVFLIVLISSLSSQFTLPLLLKSELEIHVQDLRDERYDQAKNRYTNKYELSEKQKDEKDLSQKITKIKSSMINLPQDLIHKKLAAELCLKEYRKKINSSIGPDVDDEVVSNLYAHDKIRCEQLEMSYKEDYRAYISPRQAELVINEAEHKRKDSELRQAHTSMKSDLQKTDVNNEMHLNAASSDVMWSLIIHNPGARMKYLMITAAQLVLELMPLLLKSILGRSPLGLEIALRNQNLTEEFTKVQHEYVIKEIERNVEINNFLHQRMSNELNSKIVLQQLQNKLNSLKPESNTWVSSLLKTPRERSNAQEASAPSKNQDIDTFSNEKTSSKPTASSLYAIS